jgi:transcription elongation GreA/GreB family factor
LETVNAVGQLVNTLKPHTNIIFEINSIKKELQAMEKENRKAVVEIVKTLAEHSKPRDNIDLEMMKEQNKKIMKNFWDSFDDSPYNFKPRRYSLK